jgi:hypothetical protein
MNERLTEEILFRREKNDEEHWNHDRGTGQIKSTEKQKGKRVN